jgi:phosphoribosylanthranilate isomerase
VIVKICGITRREDAAAAAELGADALGFVFWPESPRFIDPYRARAIVRALPAFVAPVGVFVNQPVSYVNEVASLVGLHAVQLHGDETPDQVGQIRRPVIKAIALDGGVFDDAEWPHPVTLLVDAADRVRRGGTGIRADWAHAAHLARRRRVLLAGGLSSENVREAIAAVNPFGIDVSSGVEETPGIKQRQRLSALFERLAEPPGSLPSSARRTVASPRERE